MADTAAVFDPGVFGFTFDSTDIVPVISKVSVEPRYPIGAGHEIVVTLYIMNTMTTLGRSFPFSPAVGPSITVYSPNETVFLAATDMVEYSTGVFIYVVHTEPNSSIGPYSARFNAANGDIEMVSKKYHIFTIAL